MTSQIRKRAGKKSFEILGNGIYGFCMEKSA